MTKGYLEVISLVERLHRHFLEVVKLELDEIGIHDINNIQGMMLFNIGDAEMTVGELTLRGCYLGSNVSYNVKKMVENGYLVQERSVHDRRVIHVRLTKRGVICATGSASCTSVTSRCWARARSPKPICKVWV
jgi:DNA-binding MarR family transcriptional regulator